MEEGILTALSVISTVCAKVKQLFTAYRNPLKQIIINLIDRQKHKV